MKTNNQTHEAKLTACTKRIYGVLPELKELSFGCRVVVSNEYGYYLYYGRKEGLCGNLRITASGGYENIYPQECWHWIMSGGQLRGIKEYNFKSIGRDITLCDVMRVLWQHELSRIFFQIKPYGLTKISFSGAINNKSFYVTWELTKPFHLQGEPFVSWLYGVLGLGER